MSDEALRRAVIGEAALQLVPTSLRNSLISDSQFLSSFGFSMKADASIAFGGRPVFTASRLFAAIREADAAGRSSSAKDDDGKTWSISILGRSDGTRYPEITDGSRSIQPEEGPMLLSDSCSRLGAFAFLSRKAGLPEADASAWQKILDHRPLTDVEFSQLHSDLAESPEYFSARLSAAIESGKVGLEEFIPRSRRYYQRLVGELGDASDLPGYASAGAASNAKRLIRWDDERGLLLALTGASHSLFALAIPLNSVSSSVVLKVYDHLIEFGDPISRIGAIEAALPHLSEHPELVKRVERLTDLLSLDDSLSVDSAYSDLSRLFMFVDSEISRLGLLKDAPPFYRRMASFAHASLIQRQFAIEGASLESLRESIERYSGPQFLAQSLVDLRVAPRWHPYLVSPAQLRQEFLGRLSNAGAAAKGGIGSSRLTQLLTSDDEDGVRALFDGFRPFYPGPLEGAFPPLQGIPDEFKTEVDAQLDGFGISTRSFIAAVNLANVFSIDDALSSKISGAIRKSQYRLSTIGDVAELGAMLSGLGRIAAVTCNRDLAEDVRVLVRKHRRDQSFQISILDAYSAIFFAAASHGVLQDWCVFLGRSLEDISFGPLTKAEAGELHSLIHHVCLAEPELWTTIGAARVALELFLES